MKWVEAAGLVKFDFLGLNTLTILADAEEMIRREEPDFNLEAVPLDDEATYAMLGRGDTAGVFQMASGGHERCRCARPAPECLEDIIALIALYRPGPMENIGDYVAQKSGTKKIRYLHPGLEPILKETYRHHRLSGASAPHRAGFGRLQPRRCRHPPPGHGQEDSPPRCGPKRRPSSPGRSRAA